MRKFIFVAIFMALSSIAMAQNIQFHYDLGHSLYDELKEAGEYDGRPELTTTVEMFHPDGWGSTFFFID
ncbi:MAG: DUF5020 family protein, partial [Alistipes sp.]|nr:DUF5020 family protein [Alistipes sp.]